MINRPAFQHLFASTLGATPLFIGLVAMLVLALSALAGLMFINASDAPDRRFAQALEASRTLERTVGQVQGALERRTDQNRGAEEIRLRLSALRSALLPLTSLPLSDHLSQWPRSRDATARAVGHAAALLRAASPPDITPGTAHDAASPGPDTVTPLRQSVGTLITAIMQDRLLAQSHLRDRMRAATILALALVAAALAGLVGLALSLKGQSSRVQDLTGLNRALGKDLARAERAAQRSDRDKVTFLATMAREIQTPLKGIVGSADILNGTVLDPDQRRFVSSLQSRAESLLSIVDDMLALADLDSGAAQPHEELLPPRDPILRAIGLSEDSIHAKGLDLDISLSEELSGRVFLDGARITQVLLHLIGNATKFTDTGSIRVEGRLRMAVLRKDRNAIDGPGVVPAKEHLVLEVIVSDTGIGIPAEQLTELFRPFTRVRAPVPGTAERERRGGGLGLAVCQRQVSLLGGEIAVRSRLGAGSSFRVLIPVIDADGRVLPKRAASDTYRPAQGTNSPSTPQITPLTDPNTVGDRARSGPLRILIAIENADIRNQAIETVESQGHVPETAVHGDEMLSAITSDRPDIVLLSSSLPPYDSARACHHIRSLGPNGGRIPIVLVGHDSPADLPIDLTSIGVTAHLSPPIVPEALERALDRLLGGPDEDSEDPDDPEEDQDEDEDEEDDVDTKTEMEATPTERSPTPIEPVEDAPPEHGLDPDGTIDGPGSPDAGASDDPGETPEGNPPRPA